MANGADVSEFDLECSNLTKRFGGFTAVNNISFNIPNGSFFSILGPSGCGKTTLLRMLAGFLEPDEGDIRIKNRSMLGVPPNKRPVNMVFQHLALFPMMTVAENIAYGLKRQGVPKAEIAVKVQSALDRINLPDAGPKRVDQLSGGQKQRIAIARCLVLDPDVLLLDEPLGALDLKLREHMKVELKQLQSQFGTTFVYITHDQSEALVMSDQVAVMNNGVFEQVGDPQDLYYNPKTAFVAGFVGDTNRWKGVVKATSGSEVQVATDDGLTLTATGIGQGCKTGDAVDIFVRPESVALSRSADALSGMENRLAGQVKNVLFNGANSRILVQDPTNGGEIMVTLPQTGEFNDLRAGQDLHLGWKLSQAKCFAQEAGKASGAEVA
ncbi:ABC transporter ATP-binding protein [Sneathiella chinensis]|uniref:Spermidine/putrescine import ATP-binding protein PotA 2 n=1 Tax=Sneathiella chinensis TaxID=349750 RepID=A0ABQ5U895_9PROT|nr:ABC transporter ATP-binding protein [Sneathiella chinensis]GLQ07626.1 spermidine/putrescine import ATP-binding protein PotA 2 [Sneathiella chinensis]